MGLGSDVKLFILFLGLFPLCLLPGRRFSARSFSVLSESVAFSIGFQDVAAMGKPAQQCPGEALGAEDFRPFLEDQADAELEGLHVSDKKPAISLHIA